jgi:hypothetical protein
MSEAQLQFLITLNDRLRPLRDVAPFAGRGRIADFGTALIDAYMRGETVAVVDYMLGLHAGMTPGLPGQRV